MPANEVETTGRTRLGILLLGTLGTVTAYMIWIGVSGRAIPEWFFWISTVL